MRRANFLPSLKERGKGKNTYLRVHAYSGSGPLLSCRTWTLTRPDPTQSGHFFHAVHSITSTRWRDGVRACAAAPRPPPPPAPGPLFRSPSLMTGANQRERTAAVAD